MNKPDANPNAVPLRSDEFTLPSGYRIHEYEIDRPLGGGGFGITYLAHDRNLNQPVALKEYFPRDLVTRGPGESVQVRGTKADAQRGYDWGLERFLDEARALATFRHPNIVRVLRYFKQNDTAYIVMEYESGLSLKRWLPQNVPLTRQAVLSIITPLLDGLEAVHKTGFLHRDIKPDNIYVRANGTPVLLDFGAARRLDGGQDMTSIVSPGFAPFEQYYARGNQGPWTDIYSMGAVMYWMTTGKMPLEAAARVKNDPMLPAAIVADSNVFGLPMLEAIGWAMSPDEARRPQSVVPFRSAIQGVAGDDEDFPAADPYAPTMKVGSASEVAPLGAGATDSRRQGASAAPSNQPLSSRRNLLCTIMFLDLVGFSRRSVDDQVSLKKMFNELIGKSVQGVAEESRIAIDTGDGAAICFLGDPEEALRAALLMHQLLTEQYGAVLSIRIGLHLGPVRVISDVNDRINVVGDGINVAQRVMDFAQGNQVLVSRAYYDVLSRITDDTADLFRSLGPRADKHGRLHELYAVDSTDPDGTTMRQSSIGQHAKRAVTSVPMNKIPDEVVFAIESELARHIGPLARVLIQKALPLASDALGLREALAPSIQDEQARLTFMAGPSGFPESGQPSSRRSGTHHSQVLSDSFRVSTWQSSNPPTGSSRLTQSRPSQPSERHNSTTQFGPREVGLELQPAEMTLIEQNLSKFIGPMAKVLLRREAARNGTFRDFITAVAGNIDRADQRETFLQALKKALPNLPW